MAGKTRAFMEAKVYTSRGSVGSSRVGRNSMVRVKDKKLTV